MFTGLVSVAVIVAVLGSLVRIPKRMDLVWLSVGLVAGVFAQAVLGGLTVLFDLKPGFVMAHFLLSIVLLTDALVLVRRAGQPDGPAHAVVSRRTVTLGRVLLVLASVVLVTGTVVTGAGPHSGGGKQDDVSRLDLRIPDVARVHGTMVMIFLARRARDAVAAARGPRTAQRAAARHAAARRARRAGGRRLHPVLQRHPRGARRRAHRRRDRGVERGRGALPRDVRTHGSRAADGAGRPPLLAPA